MEFNLNHHRIPLEVIEIILSSLEVSDLLNYRLVNHDWNQECLKQLRKSKKGRKYVDSKNIASVLESVTKLANSYSEPWLLPFELHMKFEYTWSDDGEDADNPSAVKHEKFCQQVTGLIALAPASVAGLVLEGGCPRENTLRTVAHILSKCSAHLTNLNVWFKEGRTTPGSLAVNILRHEAGAGLLTFPSLKILSIDLKWRVDGGSSPTGQQQESESLTHVLIRRSPNLEELNLMDSFKLGERTWALPRDDAAFAFAFASLTPGGESHRFEDSSMALRPLLLAKLKKLSFHQDLREMSDLSKAVPPPHVVPNLVSLRLKPEEITFQVEQLTLTLRTILLTFSAKLKFLTIDNFPLGPNSAVMPLKFPTLANLEHLQLGLGQHKQFGVYANPEEFNFSPANFPALKCVDIELGFYWGTETSPPATTTNLSPNLTTTTFDSVEWLRLRVRGNKEYSREFTQEHMTHVQALFPNVASLSLINYSFRDLRPVLEGIFSSWGAAAPQIHAFEFIDYTWEGIIERNDSSSFFLPLNNMENVTKFRVQRINNYIWESDLRWFTEQFPSLTRIEMLVPGRYRSREQEHRLLQILEEKCGANFAIEVDHCDYTNWSNK